MMLADANVIVVPELGGVTTALVAFVFVCVLFPHIIKNKTQFYAAFTCVLLIILLHSLSAMIGTAGFQVFAGAATGLMQLIAFIMLFMAAGGISIKELGGEMSRAFEVIRRGEEEKTVIIPLSGERPKPRDPSVAAASKIDDEIEDAAEKIDLPPDAGWPSKKSDDSSIPLE